MIFAQGVSFCLSCLGVNGALYIGFSILFLPFISLLASVSWSDMVCLQAVGCNHGCYEFKVSKSFGRGYLKQPVMHCFSFVGLVVQ